LGPGPLQVDQAFRRIGAPGPGQSVGLGIRVKNEP
jgi:hypothetical protein